LIRTAAVEEESNVYFLLVMLTGVIVNVSHESRLSGSGFPFDP